MTLRDHDYTVPNLPQYRPQGAPQEEDPGFFAELGAAFERNTAVAAIHYLGSIDFAPDIEFDFETAARQSELYGQYPRAFLNVRSEAEFKQTEARVARAAEADRVLSAGGKSAWVAALAAGIIDPVNFIPAGSIYKGYRVGNVLRTLLSTGAAGAFAGGINEAVLQADIPQRTQEEGFVNVGMSALLSAVLGGTFGVALGGADRRVLDELASDMVSATDGRTVFQPNTQPSSLGAAFNPEAAFENLPQVGELRPAFGLESTLTKINPIGRVLTNKNSGTARSLQASLDTGGMAFEGPANIGGDVETLAKQHYNLLAKAAWKRDEVLRGNRVTRLLSIPKFNEAVTHALRRGGEHSDPGVKEYATWLRANFFEPMYREATDVDLSGFKNLDPEFVERYAPRFARHSLVARDYDELYSIIYEHSVEKLTDIWSKRIEGAKSSMARDNEVADLLVLEPDAAKAKYDELEAEIAALPEQYPEQVRDAAERIRVLREEAKGATREEGKRLRAEANALAKSNESLLADFNKAEKGLKNKFRILGKSKIGIAGANRRLVERIESTLEAADKSRDLLVRKLNKLARGFEELSEEARDRAIEDAVDQLKRMKELEEKAFVQTKGQVQEAPRAAPSVEDVNAALDVVPLSPEIEEALARFVGADARKGIMAGIMDASPIEAIARKPNSPEYQALYAAGEPVRALLRNTVGDYVTLYRRQLPVDQTTIKGSAPTDGKRAVLSWTYDKKVAEEFADVNKEAKLYSEDEITSAMEQYTTFGETKVGRYRFVREDDGMQMYQGDEHITGFYDKPEELRAWMESENKDAMEANARNAGRREAIIEARVPVDSIVVGTHRALQSEFIVRNDPGSAVYIDPTGKAIIKEPPAQGDDVSAAMAKFEEADAELRTLTDLDPAMAAERIEAIQSELVAQAELLAAQRKAEVDRLTGKLRNPNEAKLEAAAMRDKAKNRWFDLLKRAAQENVTISGETADIDQLAKYYAETVSSSYLGEGARLPFVDMLGGERGPELARVLDIDETRTWSNGKKLEDFLENDIDVIMRRYLRTMASDIELKRKFGTVNPLDPKKPFMKKIEAEYAEARAEASKIENEKKRDKALQAIAAERDAVIRDLTTSLRRVRNVDGVPPNPYALGHRLGRAALNLNTTRMMGKMVINSVSDMAAMLARHGPGRFIRDGIMPLVSDWKAIKLSLREAQLAGTALDLTLHGRSAAFADIFDDLRMGTKGERGLQFLANNIGFISGMDAWNQGMKALSANLSIARTTDALERVVAGNARKADLFHLERLGIDEQLGRDIWEAMQGEGSTITSGVRLPNTEAWGKAAAEVGDWGAYNRAMAARRGFRAALARDIDDTIVTPGGERPTWATANMPGRLVAQFRSFTFSSTMKTLVAGLQQARVQGRASGSIMALSMTPFFLASGMLSYYLWAAATGGKAWEEMQNADAEKWLTEGILRGLPLGVLSEAPRVSEEVLGISPDREASNFSSDPLDLLGPSIGLMKDFGKITKGIVDDKEGLSASEVSSFRRSLPYNNLWIWDWILRPTFEEIAR